MVNNPKPVSGSGDNTDDGAFMITGINGFYADVTVIVNSTATDTATATQQGPTRVLDTAIGNIQTVMKYFVEDMTKDRYNVISSTATTWSYKYFITYHRITGVQGA